jgi:hypothetical protein
MLRRKGAQDPKGFVHGMGRGGWLFHYAERRLVFIALSANPAEMSRHDLDTK